MGVKLLHLILSFEVVILMNTDAIGVESLIIVIFTWQVTITTVKSEKHRNGPTYRPTSVMCDFLNIYNRAFRADWNMKHISETLIVLLF